MDIGSAHSVSTNSPAPNQRNERLECTETETNPEQTTGTEAPPATDTPPTQQVQPVAESEEAQPTSDSPPEPNANSKEAIGRFYIYRRLTKMNMS